MKVRRQRQTTAELGKVIKKRLIDMNMTQVDLAGLLGCTPQYITKILNGERSGKKYMDEMSRILGIDTAA